jgi:hypothetical protein
MLLHAELLISLMLRFSADVGHSGFLVFKDVEYFAFHISAFDVVVRKCSVELLLICSLRSAHTEPAVASNDLVLSVSIVAQPAKKMMPPAAKVRIRLELVIFVFIVVVSCLVSRGRLDDRSQ